MTNKLEKYQEIYARGLQDKLPPDKRAIAEELVKRGILKAAVSQPPEELQEATPTTKSASDYAGPWQIIGEPALQMATGAGSAVVGGLVGLGTLATGGGVEKAGERITSIQEAGTYQPRSPGGQAVSKAISYPFEKGTEFAGAAGGAVGGMVGGEQGRNAGQAIGETAFQSGLVLAGRPWRMGAAKPVTEASLTNQLGKAVKTGMEKGIKPSTAGKATSTQIDKYYAGATEAVKSIAKSKEALKFVDEFGEISTGQVPKNLSEFSQAITQRKQQVFADYDALQKATNSAGAVVDLTPITVELGKVANNPVMRDLAPNAAKYAEQRLTALAERESYTPASAQEAIAVLNDSLEAFYKNPSAETASIASIDALIANNLRKGLDSVIERTVGEGYQGLKKEYGALKSIEKDVNTRLLIDARKAGASTLNFYDVFSASDIAGGLLSGNPLAIAKGSMLALISKKIRMDKDPNRAVKVMFKQSDSITQKLQKFITEPEAAKVAAELAPMLQLPEGQNQLTLPAPRSVIELGEGPPSAAIHLGGPKAAAEMVPAEVAGLERLFQIAQTMEGKGLLLERLGREERHAKLVAELMKIPTTKALPPGQGFQMQNPIGPAPSPRPTGREIRYENQLSRGGY